tara:strand:+ start:5295 stop:9839 length:4545 start_codon:yes stop_codon:yes gene_type:complete
MIVDCPSSVSKPTEHDSVESDERGFALVISLALLSFLFLLVLALVTLVGVEARVAETRQAHALAKANAKLGLQIALGELQKYAGPDQRVTATASILDRYPSTPEVDDIDQPFWTGVWRRSPSAPLNPSGQNVAQPWDATPDSTWDPHPEMELTWLVSGNEGKKSDDGDFLRPYDLSLSDPDDSDDSGDSVWLVNNAVAEREDLRVMAKKSSVSLASVESGSSSSEIPSGSYAYWVGDEGVKTKINVHGANRDPDPTKEFLENAGRFQASPGPHLGQVERPDAPLGLATMSTDKLGEVVSVPELQYLSSEGSEDDDSYKAYFHDLTTDSHGVLSDVLHGGLKRDLTAGLGDDDQFEHYLAGSPLFRDRIRFIKDYDPLDWSKDGNRNLNWTYGLTDEDRWLNGPPWEIVRDYYKLFERVNGSASDDPFSASIAPRPVELNTYPNRNGEFWTEEFRSEPQMNAITPLLLEAKVGHALEMVPTGDTDKNGQPLYRARIAIYPSLALWNPYNVELEAAQYELLWRPDPKFWVYASRERDEWALKVMAHEVAKQIPRKQRLWDENGDGQLSFRNYSKPHPNPPWWDPGARVRIAEIDTMHALFLGSKRGRNISYLQSPGQGGGGTDSVSLGTGLRSVPRAMHRRAFHLYRYAPRPSRHESVSGWVRGNGHWHPIPGGMRYRRPLRLRTNAVRLAPGEKLYFTLAESKVFDPADEHVFNLRNHLGFRNYLHYNIPRQLFPPVPADEPVTFVYTGGGIGGYWLGPFQRQQELDEARQNPQVLGTALFMIKNGVRYPIKKINRGLSGIGVKSNGSYQDYGRADIVVADPSRVIGPRLFNRLSTYAINPELVFLEHNPRSLVDPWHLGPGDQWWRGQETDLEEGIGDSDLTDDTGVVFGTNPNPDESLSGDFYNDGSRIYYGYHGHSFDVAGFYRVSGRNGDEEQILPRSSRAVFFDVPRQPLMSLGALQHVNLCYFGNGPTYAIGNSYATSLVARNRKWTRYNQLSVVPLDYGVSIKRGGNEHQNTIIDYSYYANESLWDGFFFSTVPTYDLDAKKYPPYEDFDQYYVDLCKPLPNPRMVYYTGSDGQHPKVSSEDGLRNFHQAAGNLMVDGAFNVNSTSVDAWKAQLGSLSQSKLRILDLQDDYELTSNGRSEETLSFDSDEFPFPRLSVSTGEPVNPEVDNSNQDFWTGFVSLNEDQLHRLAEEIVQEVKQRGPFLSMGDFVNRRLSNPPDGQHVRRLHKNQWPDETEESRQGFRGTLQAAIHDAGINDGGFRDKYGYPYARDDNDLSRATGLDLIPKNVGQYNQFGFTAAGLGNDWFRWSDWRSSYNRRTNWGRGYEQSTRRKPVPNQPGVYRTSYHPRSGEHSHGEAPENLLAARNSSTGAMMPGWLSQADILTSLGPVINVRSDTFKIRTYGEAGPNFPDLKVWCEAVVQRVPEYVVDVTNFSDEGDAPHARPMEPFEDLNDNGVYDSGEPFTDYDFDGTRSFLQQYGGEQLQNNVNERFGRRFRIIKFRWLSPEEV